MHARRGNGSPPPQVMPCLAGTTANSTYNCHACAGAYLPARLPVLQNEQGIRKRAEEQLAQAAGERDSLRALLEAERAQQASRELAALRCGA